MSSRAVGEGFQLPWNRTVTLADVDRRVELQRERWRQQSYRKRDRKSHDPRIRYAGYDSKERV